MGPTCASITKYVWNAVFYKKKDKKMYMHKQSTQKLVPEILQGTFNDMYYIKRNYFLIFKDYF